MEALEMADQHITIGVEGMSGEHCVERVTRALRNQDGTGNVEVSLSEKRASVAYDDCKTSLDRLHAAIEEEGYKTTT